MAGVYGNASQFGAGAADPVDEKYEILSGSSPRITEELIDTAGTIGTRSHISERMRQNTRAPGGTVVLAPNAAELDAWLPRILGGAESSDNFPLAETLPSFYTEWDLVQKVHKHSGCVVSRATIRGSQGQPLTVTIEYEAIDVTIANAGTFPTISLNVASGPFIFSDLAVTVASTAYKFREFELSIDNVIDSGRFLNSQTRITIQPTDRVIQWSLTGPYGDNSALYGLTHLGVACVATFTNGNRSLSFSSNKVSFPRQAPTLNGREEIMLPLVGVARKDGSTAELVTTCDSTG